MTESEQEVWRTVEALNRAWTCGDPREVARFFHAGMVAITPVDRERRIGRDACVAGWVDFARSARIHSWREVDPLVQVYGDAAVVTYGYEMLCEMGGQELELTGRDMLTLVREDGRWLVVADHFSPYPEDRG